jgi:hypothetical protein
VVVTAGERSLPLCSYPTYPKYVSGDSGRRRHTSARSTVVRPRSGLGAEPRGNGQAYARRAASHVPTEKVLVVRSTGEYTPAGFRFDFSTASREVIPMPARWDLGSTRWLLVRRDQW